MDSSEFRMPGLEGKVVVFAGAGGIATAAAAYLGASGAKLVVGDLLQESAERTAQAARDAGGDAIAVKADLSVESDIRHLVAAAIEKFGKLDGLFNVAAELAPEVFGRDTKVADMPLEVWQRTFDVNLTGFMLATKYAMPHLVESGYGSIVNLMSDAAYLVGVSQLAYASSKAGIGGLMRHVASLYGSDNVRSNSIAPGMVLTPNAMAVISEEMREELQRATPLPRLGRPEDIGAMAAFFLSDLSGWITGQVISVSGGQVMRA